MKTERKADVVMMEYGSGLYGLKTANSDTDYKGVFFNTVDEFLSGKPIETISWTTGPEHAKNGAGDIDYSVMSLHTFIRDAIKGDTTALDMLHCKTPISSSKEWEFLVANRSKFYSKEMAAFVGFVRTQAGKYSVKGSRLKTITNALANLKCFEPETKLADLQCDANGNDGLYYDEFAMWVTKYNSKAKQDDYFYQINGRNYQSTIRVEQVIPQLEAIYAEYGHRAKKAEANEGMDWKALSHALRVGYQSMRIYRDGDYSYPLPESDFIMRVKLGKADYLTEIAPALDEVVSTVERLAETNDFPEVVDSEYWDKWLIETYRKLYDIERFDDE